jgi:hypothetical protein
MVLIAAGAMAGYSGSANASAGPPKLLKADNGSAFMVRPATMTFGNGGFFITGPGVSQQELRARRDGHIRWASWAQAGATGKGTAWINNCNPDCASSRSFSSSSASIEVSSVKAGRYTRLVIMYRVHGKTVVNHDNLRSLRQGVYYWG